MAYHAFIPDIQRFLYEHFKQISILEVGIDKGQSLIPILQILGLANIDYVLDAVDIEFNKDLQVILKNWIFSPKQLLSFHTENSLTFLKKTQNQYNLILLDGDHNYFTVSQELEMLQCCAADVCMLVVDDYGGKWAERDLFYSTREEYANNTLATPPQETEKQGVKAAVDEFLANHPEWAKHYAPGADFVVLTKNIQLAPATDQAAP